MWYGKGEYELILDRQHRFEDASPENEELEVTEGDGEALILAKRDGITGCPLARNVDGVLVLGIVKSEWPDPAAIIVRYIAETPFQAFYRRKQVGSVKHGWGERLAAYYWPLLDRDWQITCRTVTDLSCQIQQAIRKLEMCAGDQVAAEELLAAFKQTCVWVDSSCPSLTRASLRWKSCATVKRCRAGRNQRHSVV